MSADHAPNHWHVAIVTTCVTTEHGVAIEAGIGSHHYPDSDRAAEAIGALVRGLENAARGQLPNAPRFSEAAITRMVTELKAAPQHAAKYQIGPVAFELCARECTEPTCRETEAKFRRFYSEAAQAPQH